METLSALLVFKVRETHRPTVDPIRKCQQCRSFISSLILTWTNYWTNSRSVDHLRPPFHPCMWCPRNGSTFKVSVLVLYLRLMSYDWVQRILYISRQVRLFKICLNMVPMWSFFQKGPYFNHGWLGPRKVLKISIKKSWKVLKLLSNGDSRIDAWWHICYKLSKQTGQISCFTNFPPKYKKCPNQWDVVSRKLINEKLPHLCDKNLVHLHCESRC